MLDFFSTKKNGKYAQIKTFYYICMLLFNF